MLVSLRVHSEWAIVIFCALLPCVGLQPYAERAMPLGPEGLVDVPRCARAEAATRARELGAFI